MSNDVNNNDMIEKYLLGELSGDALDRFNDKLASDEEFRKEVSLEKAIFRNLRTAGRNEWALKLRTIHQEMEMQETENAILSSDTVEEDNIRPLEVAAAETESIAALTPAATPKVIPLFRKQRIWLVAASVALFTSFDIGQIS